MRAYSDLVVIRYLHVSCVIAIPLSLVGAAGLKGLACIPTHYCGKVSGSTGFYGLS